MNGFKVTNSKIIYKNHWITLKEYEILRRGSPDIYSVIEREDSVVIIPISPSKQTILLKQYRYPLQGDSWELPMGGINENEKIEDAAKREFFEETGLNICNLIKLSTYHSVPALSPQKVFIFVGKIKDSDLSIVKTPVNMDDIQTLKVVHVDDVFKMARDGAIVDGFTIAGLFFLKLFLDSVGISP